MKKSIYLVIALCMTVFSSCSSDDDSSSGSLQGQTAKIELTLTGSNANTRASGADPVTGVATAEATVGNIVVGIFKDENVLVIQEVSSPSTNSANTITVPSVKGTISDCTGVVVANVPAASLSALKSATTKSLFLGETISLQNATTLDGSDEDDDGDGDVQVSTILPMSGEVKDGDATTFSLTGAGTTSLAVSLVRMVSRITLTSLTADFTGTADPGATFKLQRVFLRDAIATTKVTTSTTPADAMPSGASYISGGAWDETTKAWKTDDGDVNLFLYDKLGTAEAIGTTSPIGQTPVIVPYYWFYAFANSGSTNPTAFVIQGLFDQDGSGTSYSDEPVFYPVIINKAQDGTTGVTAGSTGSITRNNLYNLSVAIKGKGVSSPTENIGPSNLSITVTVAPWPTAIEQTVEFN
ncbi:MAG: Mfa1 fimbrilin C-terminal domain-containing protein [Bacteroides sp.]|jgi:hypothetical protein|nr:Mfa1 fimbrilin C-terminal domain-containing protein [Bacteroides sp.]